MFLLKPFDKRWRTMPSELCMQCPRFTELCRQDLIRSSIGEYMSCRHCPSTVILQFNGDLLSGVSYDFCVGGIVRIERSGGHSWCVEG